jgi:signal transduction histidine kinase
MSEGLLGLSFSCDEQGRITAFGTDQIGVLNAGEVRTLFDFVEGASHSKVRLFLDQVIADGLALLWEIGICTEKGVEIFNFFGAKNDAGITIMVSRSPQNIFTLYDELLRMLNEQSIEIRRLQNKHLDRNEKQMSSLDFHAFTEITNELATAQRELEKKNAQLRRQEERFSTIIKESLDAILILDEDHTILFANPRAESLFETPHEKLIGSRYTFGNTCEEGIRTFTHADETKILCLERRTPLRWEDRPALMLTLTDVTAEREMTRLKADVDRIMRHDLKTPLNAVINYPVLMLDEPNLTPLQVNYLTMIRDEGMRMLHMVNLSLNLFKIEQGTYNCNPTRINVLVPLSTAMNSLEMLLANYANEFVFRLNGQVIPISEAPPVYVLGEQMLANSMFNNLLKNAIEASPQAGRIEIDVVTGTENVTLAIANEGAVPESIRKGFFDKYTTARKSGGTGLGTYSARRMAEVQNWRIDVEFSDTSTRLIIDMPIWRD